MGRHRGREEGIREEIERSDVFQKSFGELAQLARAPALHAGGHRFDSDILHGSWKERVKGVA